MASCANVQCLENFPANICGDNVIGLIVGLGLLHLQHENLARLHLQLFVFNLTLQYLHYTFLVFNLNDQAITA